jgi:parallel beta-helix repeat protein
MIPATAVFRDGFVGLLLFDTTRTQVVRNRVSGGGGFGIGLFGSDDNHIVGNALADGDQGIGVVEDSSRNLVRHNTISHELGSAIDLGPGGSGNRVEYNRVTDNGDGILFTETEDNVIRRNVVTGTGTFGADTGGFGLLSDGADHNILTGNRVTGGRGPAIFITTLDAPTPSEDNVIERNVASSRLVDAILVDNGAAGTQIERNTAIDSGDDGIDIDVTDATLTRNTASRNADLGIGHTIAGDGAESEFAGDPFSLFGSEISAKLVHLHGSEWWLRSDWMHSILWCSFVASALTTLWAP